MYRNLSSPSSNIDSSEDTLLDISTAPTTPDGSLTFSPVLQALKLQDALEDAASGRGQQRTSGTSLDAAMRSSGGGVKNICCIGAGYVGRFFILLLHVIFWLGKLKDYFHANRREQVVQQQL